MSLEEYRRIDERFVGIPPEMEALVLSGDGFDHLALEKIPVPEPGPDQILARVDACYACSSDSKVIENAKNHPLMGGWDVVRWPVIIGHEGCVTAVKVGENLSGKYRPGQTFAIQPAINIGPINHRERYANAAAMDKVAIGYTLGGLFAEYVLIIEEVIQTDSLICYDGSRVPYYAAAFGEPLSCVYSAQNQIPHVYKEGPLEERVVRLGPRKGGVTLILGAGPMGLLHADMAMMHRPRAIIVSEPLEGRRAQAEHILRKKSAGLGIELVITEPNSLAGVIARVTDNRGVDDCITALGIARIQEESLTYLARGGVASFFGGTKAGESLISVDTRRIHYDGISMVGSSGGDPSDVHAVMKLLASGEIKPELYVQRVGGLDAALSLVKAVKNQEFFGKGVIYPHVRQRLTPVKSWSAEDERRFLEQKLEAR